MTRTVNLDADLLNTMTPEERAEIEGADDAERASLLAAGAEKDPVHGADKDIPGDRTPDEIAADDKDEDESAGSATPEAADAAPAEAAPAEGAAQAAEAAPAVDGAAAESAPEAAEPAPVGATPALRPSYTYELPADFEERAADVRTQRESLLDRYDAGELTREELRSEQAKLDDQARELDSMRNRADIARDMREQTLQHRKQAAIDTLFDNAAKPEFGGVDYRSDQGKFRDLDAFVKVLAADDANAEKPLEWFLNEAHRRVRALHGIAQAPAPAAPAAPANATPAQAKAAAAAKRRPEIPQGVDLSAVPGGGDASDVGGEFADVMDLEGEAYEDAIAAMAKSQPQRFARFMAQH